jgi:hypothetical protein
MIDNLSFSFEGGERIKAEFLAQEGQEAVKTIAGNSWSDLSTGTFGLALNNNLWQLVTGPENLNQSLKNGQREIIIEDAGANLKKVTAKVVWQDILNNQKETELVSFLGDWQRTLADSGWPTPTEEGYFAILTSAKSVFHLGNYTYIGTLNYAGLPDFYIFDTSDLKNPVLISYLDLGAKTWATINSIYVVGNYAYLATSINGREFVILDISNPQQPYEVAYQTTQTMVDATSVYVSGNFAYLSNLYKVNQGQLYVFNVANPLSPFFVSRISLDDSAYNLAFANNYVFVASGKDGQELQIIDVSNPLIPYLYSSLDLPGTNDAYGIYVKDIAVFVVRASGPDSAEFYIIDITDKLHPQIKSFLELGANFYTVYDNGQYIMVGGDLANNQFQVIDVSNLQDPKVIATLDIKGMVYGLVADDKAAYLAVGGDENSEKGLKIIVPGF